MVDKNPKIKLSIIVPCFNEINTIDQVLKDIKNSEINPKEIIIIDDGWNDVSREYLKKLDDNEITTIFHQKNKGKGAAISTGINAARGEVIIIQDADLEYDPKEYFQVIGPILEDKADEIYGSRFQGG